MGRQDFLVSCTRICRGARGSLFVCVCVCFFYQHCDLLSRGEDPLEHGRVPLIRLSGAQVRDRRDIEPSPCRHRPRTVPPWGGGQGAAAPASATQICLYGQPARNSSLRGGMPTKSERAGRSTRAPADPIAIPTSDADADFAHGAKASWPDMCGRLRRALSPTMRDRIALMRAGVGQSRRAKNRQEGKHAH